MAIGSVLYDRSAKERLSGALRMLVRQGEVGGRTTLEFFLSESDLERTLASVRWDIVVVERSSTNALACDALVASVRLALPSCAVLGYTQVRPGCSADILALAKAGVHGLALGMIDDFRVVLSAALQSSVRTVLAEMVLRELQCDVEVGVKKIVRFCLTSEEVPTVEQMALALCVHRRTLVNRLRAARLPGPQELAGWCRLLLAARLLEDAGRSTERVAFAVGYSSANALRNTLRRYTSLTPRQVRESGGLDCVLSAFRERLGAMHSHAGPGMAL